MLTNIHFLRGLNRIEVVDLLGLAVPPCNAAGVGIVCQSSLGIPPFNYIDTFSRHSSLVGKASEVNWGVEGG